MPYISKHNPQTKDNPEIASLKEEIFRSIRKLYALKYKNSRTLPGEDVIETAGKLIGEDELVNGTDAILDGWWTDGRYADEFIRQLCTFIGIRYGLLVNSGSSANLVAFASLTSELLGKKQIKAGDEVITIAAAFPTTVNPIVQSGCVPVFVDVDLTTLNIDCSLLEDALSSKTKAIMVAHTQGNPFQAEKVAVFAREHGLWFIEDCCDALGATYKDKNVGTYGDLATFSFYPAHQMTMGEGGAVLTNNPLLYRIAKSFRDWGRDCWCETGEDNACRRRFSLKFKNLPQGYDHKFVYSHLGYNLKLTDMQAAIGLAQVQRIHDFISKRRKHYDILKTSLLKFSKYFIFQEEEPQGKASWFGFMITLKQGCPFTTNQIVTYLNDKKIATRPLYCGNITLQPYFEHLPYRVAGSLKNTDYIMNNTFWIGVHPKLTKEQLDYIVETFEDFINTQT